MVKVTFGPPLAKRANQHISSLKSNVELSSQAEGIEVGPWGLFELEQKRVNGKWQPSRGGRFSTNIKRTFPYQYKKGHKNIFRVVVVENVLNGLMHNKCIIG